MSLVTIRPGGWTENAHRKWGIRCDRCGHWALVAQYYECYPPSVADALTKYGWWNECQRCMITDLTIKLEEAQP